MKYIDNYIILLSSEKNLASQKISGCGQRHLKLQTSCFCPSVIVPNCSLALIFVHNLVAYSNDYLLVVISNLLKP